MPPKPFKPPRPSSKPKAKPGRKPAAARKPSKSSKPRAEAQASDSDADPFASAEQAVEVVEVEEEEEERREGIPPELLTRLLHECFTQEGTRLSRDANAAVGKYMETFVREALARAAFMRAEAEKDGSGGGGYGFLEVCVTVLASPPGSSLLYMVGG